MSDQSRDCTCSTEGYSPDCPNVFFQNGVPLHSISAEAKLKPRLYIAPAPAQIGMSSSTQIAETPNPQAAHKEFDSQAEWDILERQVSVPAPLRRSTEPVMSEGHVTMQSDEMLLAQHRGSLRRFEALKLGDKSLTGVSIGGFDVDLTEVASEVRKVAPLPPSKLPVIFKDNELNFLHHFIQGLEIILGRETLLCIADGKKYYDGRPKQLMPILESMIKEGYDRADNEIAIFTKKVITSTFKLLNEVTGEGGEQMLGVATNIWGFQYIEQGMQCKEADLQMWLSTCYQHYKIVWFNTFKAAGVPAFATEGVQTRYEGIRNGQDRELKAEPKMFEDYKEARRAYLDEKYDPKGLYSAGRVSGRESRKYRHRRRDDNDTWSLFSGRN